MADQVIRKSFNLTLPGGVFPRGGVVITSTAGFVMHIVAIGQGTAGPSGTGFVWVAGFLPPGLSTDEVVFTVLTDPYGARYLGCFGSAAGQPMIVRGEAPDEPGSLSVIITVVTDLTATVTFEVIP